MRIGLFSIAIIALLSAFVTTKPTSLSVKKFKLVNVVTSTDPDRYYIGTEITEKIVGQDYTCATSSSFCTVLIKDGAIAKSDNGNLYYEEADLEEPYTPGTFTPL